MPKLVDMLGSDWDFTISERLGRTSSKEQYAFVYKKGIISVDSTYQTKDPDDLIHREPFVVYARSGQFDFSLIIIHTDPDEVEQEVNYLDDLFLEEIKRERDAILLGDLNADPEKFGQLLEIENLSWVVDSNIPTNTRGTKTYDNILFISTYCTEYLDGGVFDYQDKFSLNLEDALDISDHLPVYVRFLLTETDDD
jgi:deoxyribonuclease-1-like protein